MKKISAIIMACLLVLEGFSAANMTVTMASAEESTADALKILQEQIDPLFQDVYSWIAQLYDPESGGFYAALSGRETETFIPGLEASGFVMSILLGRSGLKASMPKAFQQKFIDFFQSRQSSETGFFYDNSGPVNDRDQARVLAQCQRALKLLDAEPLYLLPEERMEATAAAEVVLADSTWLPTGFPDYLETPENYRQWLTALRWEEDSWEAGDLADYSLDYIQMLPEETQEPYLTILFDFLAETQNPETGYWGSAKTDFNTLSGCFKVLYMYQNANKTIPRMDKILASVIQTLESGEIPTAACYVRNPVDILNTLANRGMREEIKLRMPEITQAYVGFLTPFLAPDGGFSSNIGASKSIFGGIPVGLRLNEGDIDGTLQMFCVRQYLYQLLGETSGVPYMTAYETGFWDALQQTELPVKYLLNAPEGIVVNENFEDKAEFASLGNRWSCSSPAVTVDNGILSLTDDKTDSALTVGIRVPRIYSKLVIEFSMRVTRDETYEKKVNDRGYVGVNFFSGVKKIISLNTAENKENVNQLLTLNNYSAGTYTNLCNYEPTAWTRVRMEVTFDEKDAHTVRYYVNGSLCEGANDTWTQIGAGYSYIDRIEFFTSPSRKATLEIDNLRVSCGEMPQSMEEIAVREVMDVKEPSYIQNSAVVTRVKNNGYAVQNIYFINGLYENGVLIDVAVKPYAIDGFAITPLSGIIEIPNNHESYQVKTFVWDRVDMVPLLKNVGEIFPH